MGKLRIKGESNGQLRMQINILTNSNRLLANVVQAAQNELAIIADLSDPDKLSMVAFVDQSKRAKIFAIAKNWRDKPPMVFAKTLAEQGKAKPELGALIKQIEDAPCEPIKVKP